MSEDKPKNSVPDDSNDDDFNENDQNNDDFDENDQNDDIEEEDETDEEGFSLIPEVKFFQIINKIKSLLKEQKIKLSSIFVIIYLFNYHEWFYIVLEGPRLKSREHENNGVGAHKIPEIPKMFFEKVDERHQILNLFKVAVVGSIIPEANQLFDELGFKSFSAEDFLSIFKDSNFSSKAKKIIAEIDDKYSRYL